MYQSCICVVGGPSVYQSCICVVDVQAGWNLSVICIMYFTLRTHPPADFVLFVAMALFL